MKKAFRVALLMASIAPASVAADVWEEADKQVVRLDPSDFPNLPKRIMEELKKEGCTIPQTYGARDRHNVIRGSFAMVGQQDWAVLCSRDRISVIRIFWGGRARCDSKIEQDADRNWLQTMFETIVYSRSISTVNNEFLVKYGETSGAPPLRTISHDAIAEDFMEKGVVFQYCEKGKWASFAGNAH